MIPNDASIRALWEKYHLPEQKRIHVTWVGKTALFLARALKKKNPSIVLDESLLWAASLLHDIDKAIPRLPGERHPDTGVRVLEEEGMTEVAVVVKTHSLHSIVDPRIAPKTWEEKLLYLSDKMVKYEVITVDRRFALWREEKLPDDARLMLDKTYPLVKALEKEVFSLVEMNPSEMASVV
jgi:HD superfamily phosphodiesterase